MYINTLFTFTPFTPFYQIVTHRLQNTKFPWSMNRSYRIVTVSPFVEICSTHIRQYDPVLCCFLPREGDYRRTLASTRCVETTFFPFQPSNAPLMTLRQNTLLRHHLSHSTLFAHQFSRRHSRMTQQRRNSTSSGYLAYPMWIKISCASSNHPFNN